MVIGSLLQLVFCVSLFVTYNSAKMQKHPIHLFLGLNVIVMEAIFMFRMGEGFYDLIFGDDLSCNEVTEQQVIAFLAPYYCLVILRCSVYFTIAKTVYQNFKREDRGFVCNLKDFSRDVLNILRGQHDSFENAEGYTTPV